MKFVWTLAVLVLATLIAMLLCAGIGGEFHYAARLLSAVFVMICMAGLVVGTLTTSGQVAPHGALRVSPDRSWTRIDGLSAAPRHDRSLRGDWETHT